MAHEERDTDGSFPGESQPPANPLSSVFQQVTREGCFGREKKEDDQLKHCKNQVLQVEGEKMDPTQALPSAYFLVRNSLLYHHMKGRAPCDLLVIPQWHTPFFCIWLTHSHLGTSRPQKQLINAAGSIHLARHEFRGASVLPVLPQLPADCPPEACASTSWSSVCHSIGNTTDVTSPGSSLPSSACWICVGHYRLNTWGHPSTYTGGSGTDAQGQHHWGVHQPVVQHHCASAKVRWDNLPL